MLNATLLLALGLLAGAGDTPGTATVEGVVTQRGKPVLKGKITFYLDHDQFVGAKIKDGKYTVERVPPGRWKISVEGEGVPVRYASDEQSPLMVEIQKDARNQSVDINVQLQ